MATLTEIEKMTLPERLEAMELLWDSLSRDASAVESPAWHGDVLAERLEKISRGEAVFLSLDEVKRRLQRE
ncbi:MAG TPA: addiction module protein [Chthoniobacter sp.]|nr:addiction module protein [Chthoniobacter sp.]